MLVSDVAEIVDLVRAGEERGSDRMHGCVAPPLFLEITQEGRGNINDHQN